MEPVLGVQPYIASLVMGGIGQIIGVMAGYKLISYRVDRLEVSHDTCTKQRVEAERVIGNELSQIKTDVAVIKTKIDRRNNEQ